MFDANICVAPYIQGALSEEDLDEMNIEIIRNTLYKAYLEDFYQYCLDLGGETATFMGEILQVSEIVYTTAREVAHFLPVRG